MAEYFNAYSAYYNLLYANKDYTAEVDYVHQQIHQYFPEAKEVLEFGSGTGKHGLLFQQRGFDMYGLEQSPSMVEQARAAGFKCEVADITCFELNRRFDVVLSLFHVISYINQNSGLIQTFKNAAKHLRPEGLFLFDVWYSPAVYQQQPETRKKEVENKEVKVIRVGEPVMHSASNVVDVNYQVFVINKETSSVTEIRETHPMRHFSIPEIELLARMTGFNLIRAEEFGTGAEPSEKTWGVCFILRKL